MRHLFVSAVIVVVALTGGGSAVVDTGAQATTNGICDFFPWLPGCNF